jgi:hypothetical protein
MNKRAFMQFLAAQGIVREGFRDGTPGYVLTEKGQGLTKAEWDGLAWRFTYQGSPDAVPLQ